MLTWLLHKVIKSLYLDLQRNLMCCLFPPHITPLTSSKNIRSCIFRGRCSSQDATQRLLEAAGPFALPLHCKQHARGREQEVKCGERNANSCWQAAQKKKKKHAPTRLGGEDLDICQSQKAANMPAAGQPGSYITAQSTCTKTSQSTVRKDFGQLLQWRQSMVFTFFTHTWIIRGAHAQWKCKIRCAAATTIVKLCLI